MAEELEIKKCDQAGCTVSKDGVCLESFDELTECPHFYTIDSEEDEETTGTTTSAPISKNFPLFTGREMPIEQANFITAKYPTTLICIAGESECGKTTLLAVLYEIFQIGSFNEFKFAGSLTQLGFENRCFLSRQASKRETPTTPRTTSVEFNLLHLALKKSSEMDSKPTHLLLSDISGEFFRVAKNNSVNMRELTLFKKADHILFFIDGKKLSKVRTRNLAVLDAKSFIQKALDEGVLNRASNIDIIISKSDLLKKAKTFDFKEIIEKPFRKSFGERLASLNFLNIAVRADDINSDYPLGFGLHDLLVKWTTKTQTAFNEDEFEVISTREFDHFKYK
jgi:hypothetical protein